MQTRFGHCIFVTSHITPCRLDIATSTPTSTAFCNKVCASSSAVSLSFALLSNGMCTKALQCVWAKHAQQLAKRSHSSECDSLEGEEGSTHLNGTAEGDFPITLAEMHVTHTQVGALNKDWEIHLSCMHIICICFCIRTGSAVQYQSRHVRSYLALM